MLVAKDGSHVLVGEFEIISEAEGKTVARLIKGWKGAEFEVAPPSNIKIKKPGGCCKSECPIKEFDLSDYYHQVSE